MEAKSKERREKDSRVRRKGRRVGVGNEREGMIEDKGKERKGEEREIESSLQNKDELSFH